ncbi:unnamed protein product [Effrenium voratum]|nr:unnamed protein product [Effrenium voratum]
MSGQEPTEHVSCGRCSCVNSVPFGLDVFKCYKCGVAVVISRESSAACAAASPTALYLDGLQAPSSAPSSSSKSSRSFFEKLQRQVDKTLQKVEQSFFDGSSAAAAPAKTLPVGKPLESEAAGYAQSQDAQLKVAEDRALRAEQLLEAAMAREAVSSSERMALRKQLDEMEQLVAGLSRQLDSVQSEVAEQRRQCECLEKSLEARNDKGVVGELLARIAELEAELHQGRYEQGKSFAPTALSS